LVADIHSIALLIPDKDTFGQYNQYLIADLTISARPHTLTHSHMLKNVNTVIPSPNISWGYPTTALSAILGSEFCHVIKRGYSK